MVSINNSLLFFSHFLPSNFSFLLFWQNHPYHPHQHYLYTSDICHLHIFTHCHPYIPHQKSFLLLLPFSHFSLQGSSEEESVVRINSILISDGFPEAWAGITKLTITSSSSLTISQLSLLPYPTYTITRLHLPLETSCITAKVFIPSLAFLHTNHALPFVFKNTSSLP